MDANFLNIRIICYQDTTTFQFVPLVEQVAYYTNIFATLLMSTIYDLNNKGFNYMTTEICLKIFPTIHM